MANTWVQLVLPTVSILSLVFAIYQMFRHQKLTYELVRYEAIRSKRATAKAKGVTRAAELIISN